VLTDGVTSLDVEVSVPTPRVRDSHEFALLRRRLLAELGVTEELQL
jgi:sulfonate transport system ATP-binding protein